MEKVSKQVSNVKEQVFVESKTMREEYIGNVDVLDKIKAIQYLTPDMILSVGQVANYYEVSTNTIKTIINRNKEELEDDGLMVLKGEQLEEFGKQICEFHGEDDKISNKTRAFTILTRRAMLRIGMLLTNCYIASKVKNYLLNIEEEATPEQKRWAIQREAAIIDRKRMTTAIKNYIPETEHKGLAYPNYTNMIYRILFKMDAKHLRVERNVKDNDALRDSFKDIELEQVAEAETIVTALIALGFSFDYIKEQLQKKYMAILN